MNSSHFFQPAFCLCSDLSCGSSFCTCLSITWHLQHFFGVDDGVLFNTKASARSAAFWQNGIPLRLLSTFSLITLGPFVTFWHIANYFDLFFLFAFWTSSCSFCFHALYFSGFCYETAALPRYLRYWLTSLLLCIHFSFLANCGPSCRPRYCSTVSLLAPPPLNAALDDGNDENTYFLLLCCSNVCNLPNLT